MDGCVPNEVCPAALKCLADETTHIHSDKIIIYKTDMHLLSEHTKRPTTQFIEVLATLSHADHCTHTFRSSYDIHTS